MSVLDTKLTILAVILHVLLAIGVVFADDASHKLVVGSEQDYPPFALGQTDAEADGFSVELWNAVAKEVGLNYTIRVRPFHQILQEFREGKIDVLINLAQSNERRQFADFSIPHVTVNGAIFVRKGESKIHSEADFIGKSIIVLNADLAHDYAVSQNWGSQLVLAETAETGFKLLASGKHDAMLISKLAGMQALHELKITNITALDAKAGFSQKFSFAVHKGNADLLAKINEGLALTKPSGTYDVLFEKWFGPYQEKSVTFWDVFRFLAPIVIIFLAFISFQFYTQWVERRRSAVVLAENESRFRFMLETSPIAVWIAKADGREVIFSNKRYREFINADLNQANETDPTRYYTAQENYEDILCRLLKGEKIFDQLINFTIPNYGTKWALASYLPIQYNGDTAFLGWFYDITERKQSEEKLQLFARVFSEAQESITITDAAANIIDVNPAFCAITGYSPQEAVGQNPRILNSGRQPPEFYKAMWNTLAREGHWKGEIWNRRKDGALFAEMLTISALRDCNGKISHYVALASDITRVKNQQQTLELMAHYDPLTKLPNRVLFADRFHLAIARAKRDESLLAVCYLDLDGFKEVNDTLGHEMGDRLLIEVATRISGCLREEDTVSRMGGDEFALLMSDIHTLDECKLVLERIHRSIADYFMIDGQPISIAVSSGVALYPLDNADPDTLLRHADQAMYRAKSEGRNRYSVFDVSYDQELQRQQQQIQEMQEALLRNEFCLFYQPKVNMLTGEVHGVEALIRWIHPERGLIPPIEFLHLIKDTPLDIVLGNWVIDHALQQIEVWNNLGLELEVSVNISPHHLQWPQFVSRLESVLALYPQIPSHQLQFEVLESSMVSELNHISATLKTCRDGLGVNIALDDFGTGYSSLTYLRHLPVNTVKIDQCFVRNMLDAPNDYAIVDGVVGLVDAFGLSVIAEGVETRDQGLMLLIMGCYLAQGYGIAKPMPADSIVEWIKNYRLDPEWKNYGQNPSTAKDAELRPLSIENAHWVKRVTDCVNSSPDSISQWPIMHSNKCQCGRWLHHAKKDQLFDPSLLIKLSQAHEDLHHQGYQLYRLHQDGKVKEAREGIDALHNTKLLIDNILNEMS